MFATLVCDVSCTIKMTSSPQFLRGFLLRPLREALLRSSGSLRIHSSPHCGLLLQARATHPTCGVSWKRKTLLNLRSVFVEKSIV